MSKLVPLRGMPTQLLFVSPDYCRYCDLCSHEREFFIEKAIGWALRQYHQINPKEVEAYVKKNKDKLAKLSVREALKHSSSR